MKDFVICEIKSSDEAECIDRQPTGGRSLPEPDTEGEADLGFESVTVEAGWTTVAFLKPTVTAGDQDYDLASVSAFGVVGLLCWCGRGWWEGTAEQVS